MTDLVNAPKEDSREPLVSVIMNCYNSAQYLREAIDSVLQQTYQNWEIIFWDNQSTDSSANIFNSYADSRLRYFLAPKFTKLGQARNLAVAQASGEWLGFLDCDDVWLPDKLTRQVDIIQIEAPGLGLVYGQALVIDCNIGKSSNWAKRQSKYSKKTALKTLPEGWVFEKLLMFNFISLLTAIVNRAAYHEVGGISDYFEQAEDYELFVKLAATRKVRAVQSVVALYRIHGSNASILNEEKDFREAEEIVSRYLPQPAADRALKQRHSYYALNQIRQGKFWSGFCHFVLRGSLSSLFALVQRKVINNL